MILDAYGRKINYIDPNTFLPLCQETNPFCPHCKQKRSYLGQCTYKCVNKDCIATVSEMILAEKYAAIGLGW